MILWTVVYQVPQSMEFSRQEYLSGLPFPSPGVLPNPGTEPRSAALQTDSLPSEPLCLVAQSCPTLCYPMDCSLPGSPGESMGILQARILEEVAMLSFRSEPLREALILKRELKNYFIIFNRDSKLLCYSL